MLYAAYMQYSVLQSYEPTGFELSMSRLPWISQLSQVSQISQPFGIPWISQLSQISQISQPFGISQLSRVSQISQPFDIVWCHLLLCNGTACCATSAEGEAKGHSAKGTHEGGWTSTRPSATVIEAIFETIAFTTGPGGSTGI